MVNLSLIVSCFVFARFFRTWGYRGQARYGLGSAALGMVLIIAGLGSGNFLGTTLGGVVLDGFVLVIAG